MSGNHVHCEYCGKLITEKDLIDGHCSRCSAPIKDVPQRIEEKVQEEEYDEEQDEQETEEPEEEEKKLIVPKLAIISALVILVITIGVFYPLFIPSPTIIIPSVPPNGFDLSLTIQFTIRNKFSGELLPGNVTTNIYDMDLVFLEPLQGSTPKSLGVYRSNVRYWTQVIYKEENLSYTQWFKVTPPFESQSTAVLHYISLDFYILGQYKMNLITPDGINVDSNSTYSAYSSYPMFSLNIYQLENNKGPTAFYNPVRAYDVYPALTVTFNDTKSQLLSIPVNFVSPNEKVFGCEISPNNLQRILKIDGSITNPGIYSCSLPLNLEAITSPVSITISLRLFDNLDYFKTYFVHPHESIEVASLNFTLIKGVIT